MCTYSIKSEIIMCWIAARYSSFSPQLKSSNLRRKYYEDTKTAFYCYKYLLLNAIIFMSDKLVLIKGLKIEIVLFIKKKKKKSFKIFIFIGTILQNIWSFT